MANAISNFQYVGYLSDFLAAYNDVDIHTAQYKCAKTNYDNATQKLQEYQNTFCFANCCIGWAVIFGVLLLTFPVLFLPHTNVLIWIAFCALFASVIIVMSKFIYNKKVLPVHRSNLQDEIARAEQIYRQSYETLVARRSNLVDLRGELDAQYTHPLSIYLMREAAKEGECSNIPQGIRYVKNRYHTLEIAEDAQSQSLKKRIDDERERAEKRQFFLDSLDESAQSLFQ
jgi:hypothetical protein